MSESSAGATGHNTVVSLLPQPQGQRMGRHAFADTPSQARFLAQSHPEIESDGLHGVAEGWDIPLALWRARHGFDAHYPADPHGTLSIVLAGAAVRRMDGRQRGRQGGPDREHIILYPGGLERRYVAAGDVRICQMYLPSSLLANAADAVAERLLGCTLRDDRIFTPDRELRLMTDQYLRRALDPLAPPTRLEMDTRALLIMLRLAQAHSSLAARPLPEPGALDPDRLRRVTDHIEAHLAQPLSLDDLATVAGLSRHHFATAFRRAAGLSPHRYLVARRVERAKALLLLDQPLATLALDCGFASQQHLTVVFRRATGQSPAAWRRDRR